VGEYREAGKTLLQVGMFKLSSKTCSVFGYGKADLTLTDRGINAAINIKQFALSGTECAVEPGPAPDRRYDSREAPPLRTG